MGGEVNGVTWCNRRCFVLCAPSAAIHWFSSCLCTVRSSQISFGLWRLRRALFGPRMNGHNLAPAQASLVPGLGPNVLLHFAHKLWTFCGEVFSKPSFLRKPFFTTIMAFRDKAMTKCWNNAPQMHQKTICSPLKLRALRTKHIFISPTSTWS